MFKTHYNFLAWGEGYEVNNQPSLTVPDQAMSITEIISRFQRGLPLGGERVPEYQGEEDLLDGVDMRTLDLSEKHDLVNSVSDELLSLKTKPKQQKQPKKPTQLEIDDKPKDEESEPPKEV